MAKQITDEEDRLKRQARRRLIGAVALTTAIVVILPMVLDSEPRPVGQNIELRIPDKDKAGDFNPQIDMSHASAPVAETQAPSPASAPAAVTPVPLAPVVVAPAQTPQAAPAAPKAAAAPAAKPVQPQVKAPEPQHKTVPAKQESKPAPAKHANKSTARHTEQGEPLPTSGYVLQIGAFNNAHTAHSWMGNLRLQGFKAYTEKLGDKTRVRVGPYSSHAAADAARRKIEKTQGLHSNIIHLK